MWRSKAIKCFFLGFCFFSATFSLWAQDVSISLGPDEVPENRPFTITITIANERLRSYGDLPEISGFIKRGTSSSQSTNFINGQVSSTHSIIQNYIPKAQGVFELKPFTITVNDKKYSSPGKKIKVVAARQQQRQVDPFGNDPFDDFFGRRDEPTEFVDVKDEAFFALTTNKDQVYVGEGFTLTLAFYVAETNRATLQFFDISNQLSGILQKIRPANCWEENFNIENITEEPITINGKRYSQYKLYQASYYPLNTKPVEFPSLSLKMIKYKESKTKTFFGRSRQEDYKNYPSKAKTVKVKDLPPHPLKEMVSVGDYKLREKINTQQSETGLGINYQMIISGEGNISGINEPTKAEDGDLDIYSPTVKQDITRANSRVRGSKEFNYFISANNPGSYALKDYLQWVFFNPRTSKYDTLMPEMQIKITGEKINQQLSTTGADGQEDNFYGLIEDQTNQIRSKSDPKTVIYITNIVLAIMLLLTIYLVFKKENA